MNNNEDRRDVFIVFFLLVAFVMLAPVGLSYWLGVEGFGPIKTETITILTKHVDSGQVSHYMVTDDAGNSYEVDNGIILDTWNADEIYGSLEVGKKYEIKTKGNKITNIIFQSYPYILSKKETK